MKTAAIFAGLLGSTAVSAFSSVGSHVGNQHAPAQKRACPFGHDKRAPSIPDTFNAVPNAKIVNNDRRLLPETGFDPVFQYVSVEGDHAFQPPTATDIRGPCPGLNALANHGYFNRNGVTTLTQAVDAVNKVYGIDPTLGTALSAYAVVFDGNILDGTWSIGGPNPSAGLGALTDLLFGEPSGINGHSIYEADASVSRGDYYMFNGDDYSLQLQFFQQLVDLAKNDSTPNKDVYTFDILAQHRKLRFDHSVANNPNFFFSAFGGLVVTTAAHDFIVNFMSNHSEEFPQGYLDEYNLFSFFSIKRNATDGSIYHIPGNERIPDNWYRRPAGSDYTLVDVVSGILKMGARYPELLTVGGNTGKVNSYVGLNVSDLTGGVFNHVEDLLKGNNLGCFIKGFVVDQFLPSQLKGLYRDLTQALDFVTSHILPGFELLSLGCPKFDQVDVANRIEKYPGAVVGRTAQEGLLDDLLKGVGAILGQNNNGNHPDATQNPPSA